MKILIIDDEIEVCETVSEILEEAGYTTQYCISPIAALEKVTEDDYELIILDVNFPDGNGYQVCSEIRSLDNYKSVPIVFLSGNASESAQVTGYRVGGDHYISKPFGPNQLIAIVARYQDKISKKNMESIFQTYKNLKVDVLTQKIYCKDKELKLSHKEYQILLFFISHPEEIISRERILNQVWKNNLEIKDRTIDYYISQIRKKIQDDSCEIKAIYQEGYKLVS